LDAINAAILESHWCEREVAYMRAALALASSDSVAATDHLCSMLLKHPGGM